MKKRKADCERKTSSIKKSKIGYSKEVVKQKTVTVNKKRASLKLRKNKNLKNKKERVK